MKVHRLLPGLAVLPFVAGCATAVKHEVNISPKFREMPARAVCIFDLAFRAKVKRSSPEDLAEMKPERQAESSKRIMGILTAILGASLTVDSSCAADPAAAEWAAPIATDLAAERIPLGTEPVRAAAESVLLIGVYAYGTENLQPQITPMLMKPIRLGKPKLQHRVQLVALLVNPRTGEVLFDIQHGEIEERADMSQETLDELTRKAAWVILEAFFPKK